MCHSLEPLARSRIIHFTFYSYCRNIIEAWPPTRTEVQAPASLQKRHAQRKIQFKGREKEKKEKNPKLFLQSLRISRPRKWRGGGGEVVSGKIPKNNNNKAVPLGAPRDGKRGGKRVCRARKPSGEQILGGPRAGCRGLSPGEAAGPAASPRGAPSPPLVWGIFFFFFRVFLLPPFLSPDGCRCPWGRRDETGCHVPVPRPVPSRPPPPPAGSPVQGRGAGGWEPLSGCLCGWLAVCLSGRPAARPQARGSMPGLAACPKPER